MVCSIITLNYIGKVNLKPLALNIHHQVFNFSC